MDIKSLLSDKVNELTLKINEAMKNHYPRKLKAEFFLNMFINFDKKTDNGLSKADEMLTYMGFANINKENAMLHGELKMILKISKEI